MKESYENIKLLLEKLQYEKYNWKICGDLTVTALLLGYTKFCCLLHEWDSRDKKKKTPLIQTQWPKQESFIPGQKNVVNTPLINSEKGYLPSLHIKPGLIKI